MIEPSIPHLLGLDDSPLVQSSELACQLLPETLAAVLALRARAAQQGFDLRVASAYRSFERQRFIWDSKALGRRPILDSQGVPLDDLSLTDVQKVFAILRWSALPGASRHHWGTDLDVYDGANIPADYRVQLTQAETEAGGPFAEFHRWLDEELRQPGCCFYRPYAEDRGGIAPEPWHLSYAPLAKHYAQRLTLDVLASHLNQTGLELKATLLEHLPEIFQRFIAVD